ncbi:hypothetical protein PSEWESI4_03299 [Pseudomonas carbonaria]|uniref:Uncharacterized protein n=1 Tax=Zestomonas carbonaria TaxID=2762745 RepID=A0A7U7EQK8_9GAMM|nr:hypothetical protein PSEWESI4_03299 [Pseudomonas carbonaria]
MSDVIRRGVTHRRVCSIAQPGLLHPPSPPSASR